ncbi:hypothetical protein OIU80_01280 [Flavobacterium sp. LS1R47]|jgi:hypothetical protein|uniref:DUF4843 domain-containing protein n=1 Tax=Flavobacterium frigoritolerans TaxID=2987686 RepID=A0A9X2YXS4_9FLAO|nr:hypothetical protein [Flavobacterium frigoritolerans]MCV9930903.1 hypothetical protein [Flavobacterium frigoritolerans]
MKPYLHNMFLRLIIVAVLFCSCASDLDFDQTKDLTLEPVIVANLTYFDVKASAFVDNGTEQNVFFDAKDFDVFRDSFFRDNLKKAEFNFEIENTISRAYIVGMVFLDENNQVMHDTEINVPAYVNTPNSVKHTDVFENQTLDLLKKAVKLEIRITMLAGTPLTADSSGNLKLRSGATLYFEIK